MNQIWSRARASTLFLVPILMGAPWTLEAQGSIPFDSPRWWHVQSEVTEIAGRQALQGDGMLKRIELKTGRIEDILSFGAGVLDGLRVDDEGNLLVSHWEGRLCRLSPVGEVTEILDAASQGWNVADFEYLPEERLLLIPTFLDNRVRAVRLKR